ncbi:MAG TPA: FAD binding domain-containing protein [Candidatus Omnitrophota bacterium]|nr:FAD binding domain-containing protein [Candidatus Omnitrophota bacterium]
MLLNQLTFHATKTVPEAAKLLADLKDVKILAGGTFLLNSLKLLKTKGIKTAAHVLSLAAIEDLKGISVDPKGLTIRSMTTITEIFESPHLKDNFQVLRTVCRNISTTPIRNMATFGGNLTCRYTWTEMPAAMIALDARMHFIGPDGISHETGAEDFFKNAARTDKIFTHAYIPRDTGASIAYRRVKKMSDVDVPLLSLCVKTNLKSKQWSDTRVSINSTTVFAQRDIQLEEFLNSSRSHPKLGEEALKHLTASIYDTRSSEYKQHMFRVCIKTAVEEIGQ